MTKKEKYFIMFDTEISINGLNLKAHGQPCGG